MMVMMMVMMIILLATIQRRDGGSWVRRHEAVDDARAPGPRRVGVAGVPHGAAVRVRAGRNHISVPQH
jgi:hypothetical protein